MKKYLSIGEVGKMKGVSAKSLRYYGALGILPPAYINPDTGYRYYAINQMIVLDLILTCIDLEIPLKEFRNYVLPNQILDMEKIQRDGEAIVKSKINKLKKNLYQIEKMSAHLNETQARLQQPNETVHHIEARHFITTPYAGRINDVSCFWGKITELNRKMKQYDLTSVANQGLYFLYRKDNPISVAFMQVSQSHAKGVELLTIPAGDFVCEVFPDEKLDDAERKYFADRTYAGGTIVIMRELFDKKIESRPTPIEIQLSVKP